MLKYKNLKLSILGQNDILKLVIRKIKNNYIVGIVNNSSQYLHKRKRFRTGSLLCEEIFGYLYICYNTNCKKSKFNENIIYNKYCLSCCGKMRLNAYRKYRFGSIFFNFPIFNPIYIEKFNKYIKLFNLKDILNKYNLYYFDDTNEYYNYNKIQNPYTGNSFVVENLFLNFINLLYNFFSSVEIFKYKINYVKAYNKYLFNDRKILNTNYNIKLFKNSLLLLFPVIPVSLRHSMSITNDSKINSKFNSLYSYIIDTNNKVLNIKNPFYYNIKYIFTLFSLIKLLLVYSKFKLIFKEDYNIYSKLHGKYGVFRQNLLGFRVDYSGRASIVSSPDIGLDCVGAPVKMLKHPINNNVFDVNEEELNEYINKSNIQNSFNYFNKYSFIVNRAPTLHKMNTQSFDPVFTEGRSVKFMPLLCVGYNADFDGDQMGVFSVLFNNSITESKHMMRSIINLYSPTNKKNIFNFTQGIILGQYVLSEYNYLRLKDRYIVSNYIYLTDMQLNNSYINIPIVLRHCRYFYLTTYGRSLLSTKNY